MRKLAIYQSMWAMERRHTDGQEWSTDEKLEMIRAAGFDGFSVNFDDEEVARRTTDYAKSNDMRCQAMAFPSSPDGLKPYIERAHQLGAVDHINVQPDVRPYRIEDCIPYLEAWRRDAADAGLPVYFETHRDRMTTDLYFTLQLLDCFPDLRLTGDLSHFVVGREFAWPIDDENHACMHRVLDNCWAFHGRVASREQVQVQISFPQHKAWLDLFLDWWGYGFRSWRRRAADDATLTFTCELGPKEYAITGPDGNELSDRWEEALMMKDLVWKTWEQVEREGQ